MNYNKIKEEFKFIVAISNQKKEGGIAMKNKNTHTIRKLGIVACLVFSLTSVVFAKDINNFIKSKFNLGNGITTATENGYISNPNTNLIPSDKNILLEKNNENILKGITVSSKIGDFFITDTNLSVEFIFKFDENINKVIDLNNIQKITLSDLMILDEEDRLIFSSPFISEESFNVFCKNHELNFTYGKFDENYINNGLNWFPLNIDTTNNKLSIIYNMYSDNYEYPKSKSLTFYFTEIVLEEIDKNTLKTDSSKITGNWCFDVDIPENMYNRTEEYYRVISCENDNFDVHTAKVTDTGFELGITISNIEKPIYPKELEENKKEIYKNKGKVNISANVTNSNQKNLATISITSTDVSEFYKTSPYKKMYEDYYTNLFPIGNVRENYIYWFDKTDGNYILTSDNNKYLISSSLSGNASYKFVDENKYEYYDTFDMTKYNATDTISAYIIFKGNPVNILLEKIK